MSSVSRQGLENLEKQLRGLERNTARIRFLQEKGCPVGTSLKDVSAELADIGEQLSAHKTANSKSDEDLGAMIAKYRRLVEQCAMIAEGIEPRGAVLVSERLLPEFLVRLVARRPALWRCYEAVATFMGIAMIAFTCAAMTYFAAIGGIPFLRHYGNGSVSIKGLAFICGIVLGLCLHEFSHGIALTNNGIRIKRIGAIAGFIVGGFVEAEEDSFNRAEPAARLRFNACGIGGNALAGLLLCPAALAVSDVLLFMTLGNVFFGMINAFPISPLDGGWVYEDIVRMRINNKHIRRVLLSARFFVLIFWLALFTRSVLAYHS
ncbi:MAG: hypothetical protein LBP38_04860 [Desulfovibrio sp.]|jgi:Zn-dependent protease|nr:hypothetical protein [Desulfovibrio sp.]